MSFTPVKSILTNISTAPQLVSGERIGSKNSEIAPIVAILSRQLPLPQAQQLAGQTALVRVVGGGPEGYQAELEVNGKNIQVNLPQQGRVLTTGELVSVSFALAGENEGLTPQKLTIPSALGGEKTQETHSVPTALSIKDDNQEPTQKSPSFVNKISEAARLLGVLDGLSQSTRPQTLAYVSTHVPLTMEQLDTQIRTQLQAQNQNSNHALQSPQTTTPAATPAGPTINHVSTFNNQLAGVLLKQVSAAVENSGLFYESHLQQWVNGQRSTDELSREPQTLFVQEQSISEKGPPPSGTDPSVKLITAQLATLESNRISVELSGLWGQPVQIDLEPDPDQEHDTSESKEQSDQTIQPWIARLKLDMAHLGELQVRVRMVGSCCDVQISGSAQSKKAIDSHWQEFKQAMDNQGLKLVHGQYMAVSGDSY